MKCRERVFHELMEKQDLVMSSRTEYKHCQRLAFVFLSLCALLQMAPAQNSWELVSPSLPNESMESVRGTVSGLVLAIGSSGVVLRSADSGASWAWMKTGVSKWLYGVGISSNETCLAVGESGTILVSSDRGVSWTQRYSPTSGTLLAVEWLTNKIAIAAGQSGIMVKTTDAGLSWSMLSTGISWQIESLQFLSDSLGYACGNGIVARTTDAGVTWIQRSAAPGYYSISVARFASANAGIMIDYSGYFWITSDGGSSWGQSTWLNNFPTGISWSDTTTAIIVGRNGISRVTVPGPTVTVVYALPNSGLLDVSFVSMKLGFAVGSGGRIMRTLDAGLTWAECNKGIHADLSDISFWSESEGVIVGTDQYAYYSLDSGKTWTPKPTPTIFGTICHVDAMHGFATRSVPSDYSQGTYSSIWRTTDGGANWELKTNSNDFVTTFRGVAFWNSMQGCVIGDYYHFNGHFGIAPYYTTDGGNSWSSAGIGSLNQNSYPYMTSLSIVDSSTGYAFYFASGARALLRTTNSGQSWADLGAKSLQQVTGLYFINRNTGTMIDNAGKIGRTEDGGVTWVDQNNPASKSFSSVCFGTPDVGVAVGAGGAVISTTDGGKHWQTEPTLTTANFSKVYVSPLGNVVAIGNSGTIVHGQIRSGPLPVEPPPIATSFSLSQNYPNPFNGSTRIPFVIDVSGYVTLKVFDLLGREVATLVHEELGIGNYERPFDGTDLPSGIYLVRLQLGGKVATSKLVHLK
jgi:photosystem II stability/assembly factor-like uncharacterized protein